MMIEKKKDYVRGQSYLYSAKNVCFFPSMVTTFYVRMLWMAKFEKLVWFIFALPTVVNDDALCNFVARCLVRLAVIMIKSPRA